MATLYGEIVSLSITESWVHPVDRQVVVRQRGRTLATGTVSPDDTFEIELPAGTSGEIEITVGTQGVAPATVEVTGTEVGVTMMYNPGGAYY
ncbi:MAG: hypothetical protein AAF531_06055 [Actinomycetota bacterium]